MDPTVVMIGCGMMGEPLLRAAEQLGYGIALVETSARSSALTRRFGCIVDTEPVAAEHYWLDEAWLSPAQRLAQRVGAGGVVPFTEPHVLAANLIAHARGLPGAGMYATLLSRNKALQRAEFSRLDLPQPAHVLADPLPAATPWALERLPVVVKPLSLAGSEGVERIADAGDWGDAVRRRGAERPLLVEEYIPAQEYSWQAIVRSGRTLFTTITRKETTGPPDFVEILHEAGYGATDPALHRAADDLGCGVLRAIGVDTGIVCLEFRAATPADLTIMEVMVRMPGDHLVEIDSLSHGVDLYATMLRLAVGADPRLDPPARGAGLVTYAASMFLTAPRAGVLESTGLDALRGIPGVVRTGSRLSAGALVRPARCSGDRIGFAILQAPDPDRLRALVDQVRRELVTVVREPAAVTGGG